MRTKVVFIILFLLFILALPAWAHKVNVFCYIEGNKLCGETYFSAGKPALNAQVEVYEQKNNYRLAHLKTDKQGKFCLSLEKAVPLKVVVYAGQGHRAETLISPEAEGFYKQQVNVNPKENQVSQTEIEQIIEQKIKPLREKIILLEKKISEPSIVEVLGGIGWIIGIFSLLYLWKRKDAS